MNPLALKLTDRVRIPRGPHRELDACSQR